MKDITFTAHILIINDKPVVIDSLRNIIKTKDYTICKEEKQAVTIFKPKYVKNDRYLSLRILEGKAKPRNPNVVNVDTGELKDNQRKEDEAEPISYFALIDLKTSYIWINNSKKKNLIIRFIAELLKTSNIYFKSIYNESEFIKSLKSLDQLQFSAAPDLFSNEFDLSRALANDVFGYEADIATITLDYITNKPIKERLKNFLRRTLKHKDSFNKIVISGRDKNNLGMLFNTNSFSRKIELKSSIDDDGMFIENELLDRLIEKIENE